jgi:hypothetical protein
MRLYQVGAVLTTLTATLLMFISWLPLSPSAKAIQATTDRDEVDGNAMGSQ